MFDNRSEYQKCPVEPRLSTVILWVMTGIISTALTYALVILIPVSTHPSNESNWLKSIYKKKEAAARKVNREQGVLPSQKFANLKRIILVGGSNVHFGLRASIISQITGLPTINFGTHAGLGAQYILSRVNPSIESGDLIVLALEYELFKPKPPIDQVLASFVRSYDRDYWRKMSLKDGLEVSSNVMFKDLIQAYSPIAPPPSYLENTVSASGDEGGNTLDHRPYSKWASAVSTVDGRSFLGLEKEVVSSVITSFIHDCRLRGATVVATWPNLVDLPSNRNSKARQAEAHIAKFYSVLSVPIIGSPDEALIPPERVFDTPYHPIDTWSDEHSHIFASQLYENFLTSKN